MPGSKENKRKSPAQKTPLDKAPPPIEKRPEAINKIFKPAAEPKKKPVSNQGQRPVSEDVNRDRIKMGLAKEGAANKSDEGFFKELPKEGIREIQKEQPQGQKEKERNRSPFSYRKEVNQLQPQNLKEKMVPILHQKKDGSSRFPLAHIP